MQSATTQKLDDLTKHLNQNQGVLQQLQKNLADHGPDFAARFAPLLTSIQAQIKLLDVEPLKKIGELIGAEHLASHAFTEHLGICFKNNQLISNKLTQAKDLITQAYNQSLLNPSKRSSAIQQNRQENAAAATPTPSIPPAAATTTNAPTMATTPTNPATPRPQPISVPRPRGVRSQTLANQQPSLTALNTTSPFNKNLPFWRNLRVKKEVIKELTTDEMNQNNQTLLKEQESQTRLTDEKDRQKITAEQNSETHHHAPKMLDSFLKDSILTCSIELTKEFNSNAQVIENQLKKLRENLSEPTLTSEAQQTPQLGG